MAVSMWVEDVSSLVLLDIFDERLLVDQACVLSIAENAQITQSQLGETLVDKIDGRMYIERDWSLDRAVSTKH